MSAITDFDACDLSHASNRLSAFVGLPPHLCTTPQLSRIESICFRADTIIPRNFMAHTEVQRQIGRYTTQLDGMVDNDAQRSLTSLLDRELDNIKLKYYDVWDPKLETDLQAAKLYLYALSYAAEYSLTPTAGITKARPSTSVQMLLQHGLTASVRLIAKALELHSDVSDLPQTVTNSPHASSGNSSHLLFYPKPFFTNVYFAAVFLLKFLVAQPHASQQDRELAINSTTTAHRILSAFHASRDHRRGALIIEIAGRMTRSGGLPPGLHITDRLGASLMYDNSLHASLLRNRDPKTGVLMPLDARLTLSMVSDLPPAPEQLPDYTAALASSNNGSDSIPGQSPGLEQFMLMDQNWTWGMWDNQIFDSLATGIGFEDPDPQEEL